MNKRANLNELGMLLTKVDPRMPAAARESIAVGVTCKMPQDTPSELLQAHHKAIHES